MKKTIVFIIYLMIGMVSIAATVTHPVGLQVSHPDEWKQQVKGNKLKVTSPDGKAIILFNVIDAADIPEAMKKLNGEIKKIISDPVFEHQPKEIRMNNLRGILSDGSGTINGGSIKWLVGLFVHNNKALMVLGVADASGYDLHKETLEKIIRSIRAK